MADLTLAEAERRMREDQDDHGRDYGGEELILAELDRLRAQRQAVLDLHRQAEWATWACRECSHGCGTGETDWPCDTVEALGGVPS